MSDDSETRERNLSLLKRVLTHMDQVWLVAVLVALPLVNADLEPVRFYGLIGLALGKLNAVWSRRVIAWCDRTGREWDGSWWFPSATALSILVSTFALYLSIGVCDNMVAERTLDGWREAFSYSGTNLLTAFLISGLFCSVGAHMTTVIVHYRRGEHVTLRNEPANPFWQVVLLILVPILLFMCLAIWLWFT